MTSLSRRHLIESPSFGKKKGLTKMAVFSKRKKKTLAEMIAKAEEEQRPRMEYDLTGQVERSE